MLLLRIFRIFENNNIVIEEETPRTTYRRDADDDCDDGTASCRCQRRTTKDEFVLKKGIFFWLHSNSLSIPTIPPYRDCFYSNSNACQHNRVTSASAYN